MTDAAVNDSDLTALLAKPFNVSAPADAPAVPSVPAVTVDHEAFIRSIRDVIVSRIADNAVRARIVNVKLMYGVGLFGTRGGTYFGAWRNGDPDKDHEVIEVGANCEESPLQLAGTTIHEIAHVAAGKKQGHGATWKQTAAMLGLIRAEAAGQTYDVADFDPAVWLLLSALPVPGDGVPLFKAIASGRRRNPGPAPCPLGIGTRGGKSRGPGSGSRLVRWICDCVNPPKLRGARSAPVKATCKVCNADLRPEI